MLNYPICITHCIMIGPFEYTVRIEVGWQRIRGWSQTIIGQGQADSIIVASDPVHVLHFHRALGLVQQINPFARRFSQKLIVVTHKKQRAFSAPKVGISLCHMI